MKRFVLLLTTCLIGAGLFAQSEELARKYAETISREDLEDLLTVIASDAMQGRETGEKGQKMAAAFIAAHFQDIGLEGPVENGRNFGYYQPVHLYKATPGNIFIKSSNGIHKNFEDVIFYGSGETDKENEVELVFVGSGSEEDFAKVNVEGKATLAIVNNSRAWRNPTNLAKKNGAVVSLVINTGSDEEFNSYANRLERWLSDGRFQVEKPEKGGEIKGVLLTKPSVGAAFFNKTFEELKTVKPGKLKNAKISFQIENDMETMETENVLGYIEGTDLKDELVVLTAHYDHEGMDGKDIYNGADDDGSGTSAVLEIAEAFRIAKEEGNGPRRSMLFMLVTGEEKGLLGSAYYAANPVFPLENTVVDLNIDMIGRIDPAHENNPDYVYLVGSNRLSSELHEISEKVNSTFTNLKFDYTYNDESHPDRIYYRSDHWNFAKNNVPIIFYFNGTHEDYHRPTDTVDKIEFDLLTKRTHLVFYTAWVLANRDKRPVVDKLQDQQLNQND